MGEVYRATDVRLDRTVAIKVLLPHLVSDAALRQRLEREARAIASLNHPHICTLHDIGQEQGADFLVMEYLDGDTLARRLTKGALPPDQVLRYAIEMADALDKAHRQGVVHRDLKPGNIMLTKAGTKLLDFGLAKLKVPAAAPNLSGLPASPAHGEPLTEKGTLLGTVQYMAPEQLAGKEADARADIFALGTVIYEMATGKKAFEAESQASLMAAILEHDPPPMSSLQPRTPPALARLVKKCLVKDPEDRWQTARDLTTALTWIADAGSEPSGAASVGAAPRGLGRRRLAVSLTVLAAVATAGVIVGSLTRPNLPASGRAMRFAIELRSTSLPPTATSSFVTLSPDGYHVGVRRPS